MLNTVIKKRYASYPVRKLDESAPQVVNGKYQYTLLAEEQVQFTILPVSNADLKMFPEGTISSQDIKLYRAEEIDIPDKSRIKYKDSEYILRAHVSRYDNGKYSLYIGKKVEQDDRI
jgi:hypothetical protein